MQFSTEIFGNMKTTSCPKEKNMIAISLEKKNVWL